MATGSRRRFIQQASVASVVFCSCGLLDAAHAQATPKPRGPIRIDGKRVRTVDAHAHCYFRDAIDLMGDDANGVLPPVKGVREHFIGVGTLDERLRAMDAQSIDTEVLSINPFWYRKDVATAKAICDLNNRHLSELCASRPDRFAGLASLTMQDPALAAQQLDEAVTQLGLKGAAIGGSVAGDEFSDPRFQPVLAKAEALDAVLFIHPQSTPELARRFKGNGWISNVIGNPLDTTIALQRLIYEGVLDRYPKLKVLAAHGGGFQASNAARSDHSCFVSPTNCSPDVTLRKRPSEYLKQLYFDSLVFTPENLRHLVAQVGASQVVVGSDHPIPWEEHPIEVVMETKTLSTADRVAILGGNARTLFRLGVAA
jgi:predicted TIM-barrel fold metal-dependent hydrolase